VNTESVDCRRVNYPVKMDSFTGGLEKVGDFTFDDNFSHIYIWVPGCSGPDALAIQKGNPGGPRVWGWDGNEDKPTLTPSINALNQWHGYLKAGRLVSC
jgi:hypothetical protein